MEESSVQVVRLSVDGRFDEPLGLGNPLPTLAWTLSQRSGCSDLVCPGDRQTAYNIQAAATVADLDAMKLIWDSGKVAANQQHARFGKRLGSRESVAWRLRVWDALGNPSSWSKPSTWTTGLLSKEDWGEARWIDYPDRTNSQPLPLFLREFTIPSDKEVVDARFYLSGVGLHHATVNGEQVTDEVLAPGYSNYQLSSEYRTYDIKTILRAGLNSIAVRLGNGPAYIRSDVTNPAVGRNAPYAWWQSQLKGSSTLDQSVQAGATSVQLNNVTGYHLGGTINIDTAAGGDNLESRTIASIDNKTLSITFDPSLLHSHEAGSKVTGSGNNIAARDPSAGAAVTPRLIGRLEITYAGGSNDTIVTDRSWRTALGPLVLDAWYSGSDYDARREQPGWDLPGASLNMTGWISAGIAPPPNLATKLVARAAEYVKIQERITPVSVTNPALGIWVFDFGQNFAGWAQINLPELPAGVVVKVSPAESLNANGTIEQSSLGPGTRGTDLFYTYTTAGRAGGETWHPEFNYFGMQWVQVTGLPDSFEPQPDLITGIRLQTDVPVSGTFSSSNSRINRIHKMSRYSFASNLLSVFTDCPGREKLSYPADYTMPMGAIYRNFHVDALLRTSMHHLVEGQSVANTPMYGNVALKTPVYDWGYTGRFGDEINWGNAIVLVPSFLYDLYGDTTIMAEYYDQMTDFIDYIQREKADGYIVDAALADWVADDASTSGRITGTWGYYLTTRAMARIANLTGHEADSSRYTTLAENIHAAFNAAFWNDASGRYTNTGNNGTSNATQATQALALDAGLVPEDRRQQVLDALVELICSYPLSTDRNPHLSGGHLGLGPIIRVLSASGRDDVLWESLQENDKPSYGFFLASTTANPDGFTTVGENWDRSSSKNHMILAQIDEWFYAGIAGIRPNALNTVSSTWENHLVFQPKPIGDLVAATGTFETRWGKARSEWNKTADGHFTLEVTVPCNTQAEVRLPAAGDLQASVRARWDGNANGYAYFTVPAGKHSFNTTFRTQFLVDIE
ncbi:putative alpha-l-rhamnosidase protein [Colletotrichum karsti]|uniref:alpha-L-rhamnosidase n=1 Tax=Colletotrichum karsti TaxID=1095194 RepID=A0A9P6I2G5_9PEZI|nr:putative alpha-l-rhamnosidase protein [Colletotrichum karsti]KAF9874580.1 putative alpha-l-rhamnosidase protein [Colletotrichum karsti]